MREPQCSDSGPFFSGEAHSTEYNVKEAGCFVLHRREEVGEQGGKGGEDPWWTSVGATLCWTEEEGKQVGK